MPTLCDSSREHFSYSDITRGDSYFRGGHVSKFNKTGNLLHARVQGHSAVPYKVTISMSGGSVESFQCNCPKYDRSGSCKHVWAALCQLDHTEQTEAESLNNVVPATICDETTSSSRIPSQDAPPWSRLLQSIRQQASSRKEPKQRVSSQEPLEPIYLLRIDQQDDQCPQVQIECSGNRDLASFDPETPSASDLCLQDTERLTLRKLQGRYKKENFPDQHQRIVGNLVHSVSVHLQSVEGRGVFFGGSPHDYYQSYFYDPDTFPIDEHCSPFLLQEMVGTGRLAWQISSSSQSNASVVKQWIGGLLKPRLVFKSTSTQIKSQDSEQYEFYLELYSGEHRIMPADLVWFWQSGHVLSHQGLGMMEERAIPWLAHFMQSGNQRVSFDQRDGIIQALLQIPDRPEIVWPDQWNITEELGIPQCVLKAQWPENFQATEHLLLKVTPLARYDLTDYTIGRGEADVSFDAINSRLIQRDPAAEIRRLEELKSIPEIDQQIYPWRVQWTAMNALQSQLHRYGWTLEMQGRPLVAPGSFSFNVSSGLDWFDLSGNVTYADQIVPIPVLLQAARRREQFVELPGGGRGLLPSDWIEKFGKFLELAEVQGEHFRFNRPQAMLLDSLLEQQDQARSIQIDSGFRGLRKKLQKFNGVKPARPPRSFKGDLREYQQIGLGWFNFLREFGFGGCLADDMGLGKTIQVLALLEQRRRRRVTADDAKKPSLIVVPKSLIFNWVDESQRFAPNLKIVNYTGINRSDLLPLIPQADVVLTTYGTLRNDISELADIQFDYAILDEAHAIKNAKTDTAKACFVVKADYRLTMTGTPIENHLGDLWAQFRFLNPGLLGHQNAFSSFTRGQCDNEALEQLSASVRPFILRRTKEQVLKDLPEKTEQTLYCEMSARQAKQYKELRDHYRTKLTETVQRLGLKRAKIQVLEALLRLRQAACDGRLINSRSGAAGAKIELLVEQLQEVLSEGHKVLVFSQFTSFLELLKKDLKKLKISYEYLDGKTRDRKSPVDRFQQDKNLQLFLISLKAGGHGLNLTAADYVYILDPWWNPAAEAQAIDRAHRIGQSKRVFAYRMITRGTVEEKIVSLQQSKKELADAIISGNNSLIRSLTADDLKILFE